MDYYGIDWAADEGLLSDMTYSATDGTELAYFTYDYDSNHNVSISSSWLPNMATRAISNAYDVNDQLQTSGTTAAPESYTYDLAGNLKTYTGCPSGGLVYNAVNELTQSGSVVPTFDTRGELTAMGATKYTYDGFGRLVSAGDGVGTGATFTYDGLGRLVKVTDKVANSVTAQRFYFSCGNRICIGYDGTQVNAQGVPTSSNINLYAAQGMNGQSAGLPQRGAYYYLTDQLGSVRGVVNAAQPDAVLGETSYDAYGVMR